MKTLLNKADRDSLITRIQKLSAGSTAQWGKMNVYEMIQHCTVWGERVLNDVKEKHSLIGRIFGQIVLRKVLKDEAPLGKNSPTSPAYRMNGMTGDVEAAKAKWIAQMDEFESYTTQQYLHDFFGMMTREQIGQLGFKHVDHHLRQFGA
jgi:hypothetical protein